MALVTVETSAFFDPNLLAPRSGLLWGKPHDAANGLYPPDNYYPIDKPFGTESEEVECSGTADRSSQYLPCLSPSPDGPEGLYDSLIWWAWTFLSPAVNRDAVSAKLRLVTSGLPNTGAVGPGGTRQPVALWGVRQLNATNWPVGTLQSGYGNIIGPNDPKLGGGANPWCRRVGEVPVIQSIDEYPSEFELLFRHAASGLDFWAWRPAPNLAGTINAIRRQPGFVDGTHYLTFAASGQSRLGAAGWSLYSNLPVDEALWQTHAYRATLEITYDDTTVKVISIDSVDINTGTLSGTRLSGATITATCPTASVGSVTYPTATTWSVSVVGQGVVTVTEVSTGTTETAALVPLTFAGAPPSTAIPLTTTPPTRTGITGAGQLRKATGQFYQLNSYSGSAGWKHAPLMVSDGSTWK